MRDKVFLDTNILIYMYAKDDENKRKVAQQVLDDNICLTSIQVLNEISNVLSKKFLLSTMQILSILDNIEMVCDDALPVQRETINTALRIKDRYGFSFFDCLMLASAIEGNCHVIFTEDMSDGQIINETLKIVNPFTLV